MSSSLSPLGAVPLSRVHNDLALPSLSKGSLIVIEFAKAGAEHHFCRPSTPASNPGDTCGGTRVQRHQLYRVGWSRRTWQHERCRNRWHMRHWRESVRDVGERFTDSICRRRHVMSNPGSFQTLETFRRHWIISVMVTSTTECDTLPTPICFNYNT
jgi:hypothetical protein